MPSPFRRMRETPFDLYNERDALPWYFRAVTLVSSWLALGGYVLFALVFTSAEDNLKTSRAVLTSLAAAFLAVGYGVIAVTAFYSRSLLFLFDSVLLPILTSSFMGLFVTVTNHALHKGFPIPTHIYIYIPLVAACATTVGVGVFGCITYRKLSKIKELDRQRRQHVQRWDRSSYVNYGDAASTTELLPTNVVASEDEAQRRQLLRLLLTRDSGDSPGRRTSQSTYQIHLPGEEYEGLQVVQPDARPRSESLPTNASKWTLLNRKSRDSSPTVESFKNPRERRREEIERSSIFLTPGLESGWPQTPGSSHSQSQPITGATRYA